jgi:two-component system chemotaxis response regulator CheB
MAEVKVVRRWAPPAGARAAAPPAGVPAAPAPAAAVAHGRRRAAARRVELVAIGASTGGPVALKQLLCALPAGFPVPIVIVQHMAGGFLQGMAQWLSAACKLPMEIAGPATDLRPGHAYLAPDGMHMRVGPQLRLEFADGAPVHGHRPSASCLLGSVAAHCGPHAIGILLTGMGKDGAAELKLMHDAGAITIAQDQASSVVHGMPGEAIRCGGARYVMSPGEIGAALPALVQG